MQHGGGAGGGGGGEGGGDGGGGGGGGSGGERRAEREAELLTQKMLKRLEMLVSERKRKIAELSQRERLVSAAMGAACAHARLTHESVAHARAHTLGDWIPKIESLVRAVEEKLFRYAQFAREREGKSEREGRERRTPPTRPSILLRNVASSLPPQATNTHLYAKRTASQRWLLLCHVTVPQQREAVRFQQTF